MTAAVIREEKSGDEDAVRKVVESAFGKPDEAAIVDALRAAGKVILSVLAELDGRVVGHVLFTRMLVEPDGPSLNALALGPLAVAPDFQRQGIGRALIAGGAERCRGLDADCIFLLGEPAYYSRSGFRPAVESAITLREGEKLSTRPSFQVLELRPGALGDAERVVSFQPEFYAGT